jgi:hypothetical protein
MNDYVLGGFGLALFLIVANLAAKVRAGEAPRLDTALFLVLGAVGVGTGLKVVVLAFTSDALQPLSEDDRTYLVIGGFATIWVSILTIARSFRE